MVDYEKIGLKCGIEIHQRLKTGRKLFCNCSSKISEKEPVMELKRKLMPVVGEAGKVDPAALHELARDRTFKYSFFKEQSCLVETDGEPPFPLDPVAFKISITFAKLLRMEIPDELHVMRKTVVDGSNTSGFQRTAVVGLGSEKSRIETSFGPVRIKDLELEEESAGILAPSHYRLDRLGIPLVEIGTEPDIKSPKQAYEAARAIGEKLRLLPVERGLGTIRQDVNISIKGGARIEIKGLQELEMIEALIKKECQRQLFLLELRTVAYLKSFNMTVHDVTDIFKRTENRIIRKEIENGGKVFAGVLPFKELMKKEICEGKTFGKELAEYAMAYGSKGIIHTEEKHNLAKEFAMLPVKGEVKFVVAGQNAEKAAKAVVERAKFCAVGVPEETRFACENGLTRYARPLPGKARMYPETDIEPIRITKELLSSIELPDSVQERKIKLAKLGLSKDQISQLELHQDYNLFMEAAKNSDPKLTAALFLELIPRLGREGVEIDSISENELLSLLKLGKALDKSSIESALKSVYDGKSPEEAVSEILGARLSKDELEAKIDDLFERKKSFIEKEGMRAFAGLMGEAMETMPDEDGSKISKLLKKRLSEQL